MRGLLAPGAPVRAPPGGPAVTGLKFAVAAGMLILAVLAAGLVALEAFTAAFEEVLSW